MIPALADLPRPARIRIVGLSGSGKSTLGRMLGQRLGITHLEEDSFHFTGTNFTLKDKAEVTAEALRFTAKHSVTGFVTDGFWKDVHDVFLPQINV
ncbi:hypothetical protein HDU99_010247, partial [Rhizoclosmatium hyalinum]